MEPAPVSAAGDVGGRGPGGPDSRQLMARGAALLQRAAAQRERLSAAVGADLSSARSVAQQNSSRREELKGLEDQFRGLQAELHQARSVKLRMESKDKLTRELISTSVAKIEELKKLVSDSRNKIDKLAAVISDQLLDLEALEAKSNKDAAWQEKRVEAFSWFEKLGIKVIVGKGVKFVFNQIDPQCPEEYSFTLDIDNDRYNLLQCDPHIKDIEELVKDLNLGSDFYKFVRIVREKFQDITVNGTISVSPVVSSVSVSSPVMMPVDTRREDVSSQTRSRNKNKGQSLPAKRSAASLSAASPAAPASSLRRSPRFVSVETNRFGRG
ncbi:hypothetical protein ACP70R_034946 [Stipagrostis hirtigluma subsp. patula]